MSTSTVSSSAGIISFMLMLATARTKIKSTLPVSDVLDALDVSDVSNVLNQGGGQAEDDMVEAVEHVPTQRLLPALLLPFRFEFSGF